MTRTDTAVRRLRDANPVAVPARTPVRRRRTRRSLALVGATAALAAVAFVVLPGGAGTPVDARAVDSLLAAGRAAAAAVDAPLGPGDRVYSKTVDSNLHYAASATKQGGPPTTNGTLVRTTSESWLTADGALVRRDVVDGQASVLRLGPTGAQEPATLTYDAARKLPTDPAALERWIRERTAGQGESADVEVWVAVQDMLLSPVAPPKLRAALYDVAAGLPGVVYLGQVTDPLGRTGIGVALAHGDDSHARGRMELVFDPTTGLPLEEQEVALDPAQWGLASSAGGAVVSRRLWVSSAVVPGDGVRPDGTHVPLG
jgi:hypothetical protein